VKRAGVLLCFAMFLGVGAARGQQSTNQQEGGGERTPSGSEGQKPESRAPRRSSGIVADNLDRVAATVEQILEVLNRDAGLMVELKRAIAQDAGESGQILEESDLSESAVTERLREDLRTRVLATRLLQRYGYLLPKVNPDSELAAEHNLEMRVRAQQLERASESHESNHAAPQTEIAAGTQPPAERPANQGRSARGPLAEVDGALEYSRPEMLSAPPEAHLDLVKARGRPSMQTEPAERAGYGAPAETLIPAADLPSAPAKRPPRVAAMPVAEFEPVRMDRRPNPYADVPSLYDLYVQANTPNRKTERFGLEVFRNGTADPDILPMDLPVGPDYIVGPGDSLAINLWGGVSQRLLRAVDREGRLALPEAGPLLVSGKSLGEVQDAVQRVLRTQFRDVSVDVSLLKLRSVRVYVVGEVVAPGAYDVSSLSTPAERSICRGRNYLARVAAAAGTLPRETAPRRSGRLRPAAARDSRGHEAVGERRLATCSAPGNFRDGGRHGAPPSVVRIARREKPERSAGTGWRHPAGGGAAPHRSATSHRARETQHAEPGDRGRQRQGSAARRVRKIQRAGWRRDSYFSHRAPITLALSTSKGTSCVPAATRTARG